MMWHNRPAESPSTFAFRNRGNLHVEFSSRSFTGHVH